LGPLGYFLSHICLITAPRWATLGPLIRPTQRRLNVPVFQYLPLFLLSGGTRQAGVPFSLVRGAAAPELSSLPYLLSGLKVYPPQTRPSHGPRLNFGPHVIPRFFFPPLAIILFFSSMLSFPGPFLKRSIILINFSCQFEWADRGQPVLSSGLGRATLPSSFSFSLLSGFLPPPYSFCTPPSGLRFLVWRRDFSSHSFRYPQVGCVLLHPSLFEMRCEVLFSFSESACSFRTRCRRYCF